jgi:putative Ca2+/H+ antiporter (TMEM165/GDT1 family)
MKLSILLGLWCATIGTVCAVGSTGNEVVKSDISRKQTHNLGINIVEEEDNYPSNKKNDYSSSAGSDSESEEEVSSYQSFIMAISMIIVSEIGDKTFLIAALMAMRHNRWVVFGAAFSALAVMTILSGIVGHALPTLLSQRLTQFLAAILFVVFGYKLLKEGLSMSKDMGIDEELAEVEEEIASSKLNEHMDIEAGPQSNTTPIKRAVWYQEFAENIENLASLILSPVFIQVFVMTFLGEWGDRSQIATIAMAAGSEYWIVILGATIGHGICTAAACIGGKLLAKKISIRTVTLGGSVAFFVFSILYFYEAFYHEEL